MHRFYLHVYVSSVLLAFLTPGILFAEGTKQIYPPGWGNFMFCVSHDPIWNDFALYDGTETQRLNIEILNAGEIIYYGIEFPRLSVLKRSYGFQSGLSCRRALLPTILIAITSPMTYKTCSQTPERSTSSV